MDINMTTVMEAVITLVVAVITSILIPYIKSKTTNEEQRTINEWVRIAVTCAEQIYKGQGRGEEKKKYVLNWLENYGIILDEDAIDAMIESAVYDLTNGFIIGEAVSENE